MPFNTCLNIISPCAFRFDLFRYAASLFDYYNTYDNDFKSYFIHLRPCQPPGIPKARN